MDKQKPEDLYKICNRCEKNAPHAWYWYNITERYRNRHCCRKCRHASKTESQRKNKGERQKGYRLKLKKEAIDYKGGKCQKCGYDKPVPRAYDFHHRNPEDKGGNISHMIICETNFNTLKIELDKCDLVCATCHREIHGV